LAGFFPNFFGTTNLPKEKSFGRLSFAKISLKCDKHNKRLSSIYFWCTWLLPSLKPRHHTAHHVVLCQLSGLLPAHHVILCQQSGLLPAASSRFREQSSSSESSLVPGQLPLMPMQQAGQLSLLPNDPQALHATLSESDSNIY
jgi:hypothetical protein